MLRHLQDTNEKRYTYPAWCYRIVKTGGDEELLRIGQLKHLSQPDTKFSLVFEPLGTADIDDCPTLTPNGCRLVFSPPDGISGEEDKERFVNIMGSIRREVR